MHTHAHIKLILCFELFVLSNRHNERLSCVAHVRYQNCMLLLNIIVCDIDIAICNMHGLFGNENHLLR